MKLPDVFRATLVVLFTLLGAYIIFISLPIIVTLLISIIIASAVRPVVNTLARFRFIPEVAAIIIVYAVLALIILIAIFVVIPPMFNQLAIYIEQDWRLSSRLIYAQSVVEGLISDFANEDVSLVTPEQISEVVTDAIEEFRRVTPRLLRNLGNIAASGVLIFVMGVYWLTSHIEAKRFILQLTTPQYRDKLRHVINDVEYTLGSYVRGIITIGSVVGVLNFIPMQVLGIPNAITLAFIIGTLSIIPMVGGIAGGIIATLITIVSDPQSAIIVFIIFLIVNQIENYILQPRIMRDEVGMNPLLVIVYTSVGLILGGIIGALIAIPIMGVLHILLENFVTEPYRSTMGDDPDEEIVVELEEDQRLVVEPDSTTSDDE